MMSEDEINFEGEKLYQELVGRLLDKDPRIASRVGESLVVMGLSQQAQEALGLSRLLTASFERIRKHAHEAVLRRRQEKPGAKS